MSGGEEGGAPRRCVEVQEAAGDGSMGKSCMTTKRKTAEEIVRGGQVFAPLLEDLANKRKAAADPSAAAEEEEAAAAAGENPPPGPKARMSDREVRWILSRKPQPVPHHYEALKQSNPDLEPLPGEEMDDEKESLYFRAKLFYCMEERYPKFQQWVREELATKGYVEIDDDWAKRRAEAEEFLEEEWKKIEKKFDELFSEDDIDYDDVDSDDYSEEEDVYEENVHGPGGNNGMKEDHDDKPQV